MPEKLLIHPKKQAKEFRLQVPFSCMDTSKSAELNLQGMSNCRYFAVQLLAAGDRRYCAPSDPLGTRFVEMR